MIIAADHCKILYFARQYDRAISQCHAVLQMDPRANGAQFFIFGSLIAEGKFDDAEQQVAPNTASSELPWVLPRKAYLYGRWGRTTEAQRFIADVERHRKDYLYADTSALLMAYSGEGTPDQAISLLQKAYAEHSAVLGSLKVDPMYDRLRSDSRFQHLLHRVGLDQ